MVRKFSIKSTLVESGNEAMPTKDDTMTKFTMLKSPTQIDVEMYIARAHQMRADYIARSLKAGFANLRGLFLSKASKTNVAA